MVNQITSYFDPTKHPNWSSFFIQLIVGVILLVLGYFLGKKFGTSKKLKNFLKQENSSGALSRIAGENFEDRSKTYKAGVQNFYKEQPPGGISPQMPGELTASQRQVCKKVKDITRGKVDLHFSYEDIQEALVNHENILIATNAYGAYKKVLPFLLEIGNSKVVEDISSFSTAIEILGKMMENRNDCGNAKTQLDRCEEIIFRVHAKIF